MEAENEKLRNTNASLVQQKDLKVVNGTSDSDCSTCSSSCSSSSSSEDEDSDCDETEPHAEAPPDEVTADKAPPEAEGNDKETDTGYESSNSGSNKALKGEATSTSNNV